MSLIVSKACAKDFEVNLKVFNFNLYHFKNEVSYIDYLV
jgi:hypothetical protein